MVNFYKSEKKAGLNKAFEVTCESLDILGRGVCKAEGKVYFVENLLPTEVARIVPHQDLSDPNDTVSHARVTKLITPSSERITPTCQIQQSCGGCPLCHVPLNLAFSSKIKGVAKLLTKSVMQGTLEAKSAKASSAQGSSKMGKNSTIKQVLAQKQAADRNKRRAVDLAETSKQAAALIAKPSFVVNSPDQGYRRACRLAVRTDHGKLFVGFRGAKTQELVPVSQCEVLTPRLNELLNPIQRLINQLDAKKNIGHVELLDSDGAPGVLLRMTKKLDTADEERLIAFGHENGVVVSVLEPFKQLDDTEVVRERVLNDEDGKLYVMSHDCKVFCSPSAFVQVNRDVNAQMIEKVLEQVQPHEGQKVLDLFSGLGNFTLPIAKAGAVVNGVDIVSDMVRRANDNAAANGISAEQCRFHVADLEAPFESQLWAKEQYDVVVMDPGRTGAKRAVQYMTKLRPNKIVMISCNPLAAARDCVQLVSAKYRLDSWGAFDMFPRTSHVEIMMTFYRDDVEKA